MKSLILTCLLGGLLGVMPTVTSAGALYDYEGPHFVLHVRDWAGFGQYAGADQRLDMDGQGGGVVLFGDSIFDLWDDPPNRAAFPQGFIDRGISAQTTFQMLLRFRADVLSLAPRYVVILAGTNDIAGLAGKVSLGMIEDNLASMSDLARTHGSKVVLATLLPICDCIKGPNGSIINQSKYRPPSDILELNRWIKDYAVRNDIGVIDFYSAFRDQDGFFKAEYTLDGVHPNVAGYEIMKNMLIEYFAGK